MTYILWDWNGTLLDDTKAALDTLNTMLVKRARPPIEMGFYRDHFAFPVRPFYEEIGVCLENEDWDLLAKEYHDIYAEQPKSLNAQTIAALKLAKGSGAKQSIISALRQDLLQEITEKLGVAPFMERICGVDNLDGKGKIDRAKELMGELKLSYPEADFVLIGDSLHDHEVAEALGIRSVLCAQGSHAGWRLRRVAPTADTLTEAVQMAINPNLI